MTDALSLSSQFKTKYVESPLIEENYYYSQMMITTSTHHLITLSWQDRLMIYFDKHTLEYSHHFKYNYDVKIHLIHHWNNKLYSVCEDDSIEYKNIIITEIIEQDGILVNSEPVATILMNKMPIDKYYSQDQYLWFASMFGVIWYNFDTNKSKKVCYLHDYVNEITFDPEISNILTIKHRSDKAHVIDMATHRCNNFKMKNYEMYIGVICISKLSLDQEIYHLNKKINSLIKFYYQNNTYKNFTYDKDIKCMFISDYFGIRKIKLAIPKVKSISCDEVCEITDSSGIVHKFSRNNLIAIHYFKPMLEGRWPDVVHLDYPTQLVKDLLHFLNHDDIPQYNADQLISVIGMANYLMMDRYQKELMDRLYKIVSKDADVYLQVWNLDYDYMFPILADHLITHLKNYSFDADTIDRMKAEHRFTQMLVAKKPVYE